MAKKLTPEEIAYIKKCVAEGYTLKSIAEVLNVSLSTVNKYGKGTIKNDIYAMPKR